MLTTAVAIASAIVIAGGLGIGEGMNATSEANFTLAAQLQAQQDLANSNQQSFVLSEARFKQGADSYLQVLDAQRSWYSAQQQLISGQQALLASQISLYKVLGGGWQNSNTSAD